MTVLLQGNCYSLGIDTASVFSPIPVIANQVTNRLSLIVHLILRHCTVLWKDYQHKSAQSAVALSWKPCPACAGHCTNTAAKGAYFLFTATGFSLIFELFPHSALTIIATDAAAPFLECKCFFSWHTIDASVKFIRRLHRAQKSGISLHKVCHVSHTIPKGREDNRKLNPSWYVRLIYINLHVSLPL